jgi:hypothetical protein
MRNPRPRVKITSAVECPILDSVYSVLGTRALDSCIDAILYVHTIVPYLNLGLILSSNYFAVKSMTDFVSLVASFSLCVSNSVCACVFLSAYCNLGG